MLSRFASCGVAGVLFEHLDHGVDDPDDFRASMGDLGAVPPSGSAAGGTAADTRSRLAAYGAAPLAWPEGSPCLAVDPLPDGETPDDGPADASTDPGADPSPDAAADVPGDGDPDTDPDGGCGCTIIR